MNVNANDILDAIEVKHSGDLVIPECKTGPSMGAQCFHQMDAWIMAKSWSKPHTTCYEIKTARRDFLNDTKWMNYLPYCNYMYFACPKGLITPEELNKDVGLYNYVGKRLICKKKAPWRDVTVPEQLWRYILMWRVTVGRERGDGGAKAYWQAWLADKKENKYFGTHVSQSIRNEIERRVDAVAKLNSELTRKHEGYESIREMLKDIDVDEKHFSGWALTRRVRSIIDARKKGMPEQFIEQVDKLTGSLHEIRKILSE